MTNKDEMTMNSDKNAYFLSLPEITELSVPPKTILLEEGKVADRMYLIRKGCLRLFSTTKDGTSLSSSFSKGISSRHSTACINGHRAFFPGKHRAGRTVGYEAGRFFRNLGQKPALRQIYEEKSSNASMFISGSSFPA